MFSKRVKRCRERLGLSQLSLAKRIGVSQQAIQKVEDGHTKNPRYILELAQALNVPLKWLMTGEAQEYQAEEGQRPHGLQVLADSNEKIAPFGGEQKQPSAYSTLSNSRLVLDAPDFGQLQTAPQNVPVLGLVAGSYTGAVQVSSDPLDYARRPSGIANIRNIYALCVIGESMVPEFKEGQYIYVDPHRRPAIGDGVVVQLINQDSLEAIVKILVKRASDETGRWCFVQHNPKQELVFEATQVHAVHRVIPWNEAIGL